MGLRIQTNISSINSQRHLSTSTAKMNTHMERLSSGFRINKAADDAAGLAIAEKMKAQSRSLVQARRNASDGVSLVQTAEGGLSEISNILGRLKELTIQAASDTIGNIEREYLQKEFGALKNEIDRIATVSEFNGTRLLVGKTQLVPELLTNSNPPPLEIQIGSNYWEAADGLEVPNPIDIIRLNLESLNALTTGEGSLGLGNHNSEGEARIDLKEQAQLSISKVDDAIERVNSYRATLGSIQNRLNSTINNLSTQIENVEVSKSRIKDADFAEETSHMVQQTIIQKAGISVLSQANQYPELAIKLLG